MSDLVVHCKREQYEVYVGRGVDPNTGAMPATSWGNPFLLGRHGGRTQVLVRYREHLLQRPWLVDMARDQLNGKVLGCWCAPKACHADLLSQIAATIPVAHHDQPCTCFEDRECNHCKGLYVCRYCRGSEGGLPSECPRTTLWDQDAVYAGSLNYIAGEWVHGCFDSLGVKIIPCWAGTVQTLETNKAPVTGHAVPA